MALAGLLHTHVQAEVAGAETALRAACDGPAWATLLQAEAQPQDAPRADAARGIWLDRQRLQWPGLAPAAGLRARLLLAEAPTLRALPGAPASGADHVIELLADGQPLPPALATRFAHLQPGARWRLPAEAATPERLAALHRGQQLLVLEDEAGRVLQATRLQVAGALDDLYAADQAAPLTLGAVPTLRPPHATTATLWAPTARAVALCLYDDDQAPSRSVQPLRLRSAGGAAAGVSAGAAGAAAGTSGDAQGAAVSGFWQAVLPGDLRGRYYSYLVDVWVPGQGLVRQRVTDPYSISLGADSRRSWIGHLADARLAPPGWAQARRPAPLRSNVDMSIYELHVRDFSRDDASVPPALRGKYAAFTQARSQGMAHLRALARAGLSDVHLLPVFDLATVPEQGCTTPQVPDAAPDSLAQQQAVMAQAASDCFNWGYDPLHFNAPEGSYASDAADGAVRIREFRQMVMALHAAGLRVGMDVVYNHLSASGQHPQSVLDRIVPGYYHRLNAQGEVERSTCCDNSATEHRMMARLMSDSVRLWAREYRIDSFRFDLMGHQPREAMLALKARLRADNGRDIQLIGEGWNFGEVADGARFVQAAQGRLGGTGIATFSDRARDAARGGGFGDAGDAVITRQGWLNGLGVAPNEASQRLPAEAQAAQRRQAHELAALVRLGLAGTLATAKVPDADGRLRPGAELVYAGQPGAGYAQQPDEVVNYVENHDNATLWDLHAFKLPLATPSIERARAQVLGMALTALSQGVPYFHAGIDLLRSKSMDGNSYDSGDWFNRLDWSGQQHHFGTGLPPARDNSALHGLMAPRLRDPALRATPADIAFARQALRDWLAVRASTRLLRLNTADQVQRRLRFHAAGPQHNPALIVAELDGRGLPGARWQRLVLVLNADPQAQTLAVDALRQPSGWRLHPVLAAPGAADVRARQHARLDRDGRLVVPGRSAVVWVR